MKTPKKRTAKKAKAAVSDSIAKEDFELGSTTNYKNRDGVRSYLFTQLGELPTSVRDLATSMIQLDGSTPSLEARPDLIKLIEP